MSNTALDLVVEAHPTVALLSAARDSDEAASVAEHLLAHGYPVELAEWEPEEGLNGLHLREHRCVWLHRDADGPSPANVVARFDLSTSTVADISADLLARMETFALQAPGHALRLVPPPSIEETVPNPQAARSASPRDTESDFDTSRDRVDVEITVAANSTPILLGEIELAHEAPPKESSRWAWGLAAVTLTLALGTAALLRGMVQYTSRMQTPVVQQAPLVTPEPTRADPAPPTPTDSIPPASPPTDSIPPASAPPTVPALAVAPPPAEAMSPTLDEEAPAIGEPVPDSGPATRPASQQRLVAHSSRGNRTSSPRASRRVVDQIPIAPEIDAATVLGPHEPEDVGHRLPDVVEHEAPPEAAAAPASATSPFLPTEDI